MADLGRSPYTGNKIAKKITLPSRNRGGKRSSGRSSGGSSGGGSKKPRYVAGKGGTVKDTRTGRTIVPNTAKGETQKQAIERLSGGSGKSRPLKAGRVVPTVGRPTTQKKDTVKTKAELKKEFAGFSIGNGFVRDIGTGRTYIAQAGEPLEKTLQRARTELRAEGVSRVFTGVGAMQSSRGAITSRKKQYNDYINSLIKLQDLPVAKVGGLQVREAENTLRRIEQVNQGKKIGGLISADDRRVIDRAVSKVNQWKEQNIKARIKASQEGRALETQVRGLGVSAVLGVAGGVVGGVSALANPVDTAKAFLQAIKNPVQTTRGMAKSFSDDPASVIAEYLVFGKTITKVSSKVKNTKMGRAVLEEKFIREQPPKVQPQVRAILKGAKVQEKLNPIKTPKKVDFLDVAELKTFEAQALKRALQKDRSSIVFGSKPARVLSGGKTKVPKDVDLATANPKKFGQKFINELPKSKRADYVPVGEAIKRVSDGTKILDVKPLVRRGTKTFGRGSVLPVEGTKKVLTTQLKELRLQIKTASSKYDNARKGSKKKASLKQRLDRLQKKEADLLKTVPKTTKSVLPKRVRKINISELELPTQKTIKIEGIKFTRFGEQTVRKGLGTLQSLLAKNVNRAKDASAFLESLKIQRTALRKRINADLVRGGKIAQKRANLRKRKLSQLDSAIKVLESPDFVKMLESAVGKKLMAKYPIFKKLDKAQLRRISKGRKVQVKKPSKKRVSTKRKAKPTARKPIKKRVAKKKRVSTKKKLVKKRKPSKTPSKLPKARPSKIPSKTPSRLPSKVPKKGVSKTPSKLPKRKPSRTPSRVPKRKPSKLPSKLPSRTPSKTPSKIPSKIPSKPPSRPPSRPVGKPPKKPIRLPKVKLTWETKLPAGYSYIVNGLYRRKGKVIERRLKTTPNRAFKKMDEITDNTLARSFDLRIVGIRKIKDIKKPSMVKYRMKRSRGSSVLKFVEKSKHSFDTRGEKQALKRSKARKSRK